jgi:hypothetical protein
MSYSASSPDDTPMMVLLREMGTDELIQAISLILPPATLQPLSESLIDQSFAIVDNGKGAITLDLTTLKQSIRGNGVAAMQSLASGRLPCTKAQIAELKQGGLPMCKVPQDLQAQADAQVEKALDKMIGDLPDIYPLLPAEQVDALQQPLSYVPVARTIATASLLVPLVCLALIALFAVRSKRELMRWWGVPLFIAGLLTILINRSASMIATDAVRSQLAQNNLTDGGIAFLLKLYAGIAGAVLTPMLVESLVAIVIGLGLIIWARRLRKAEMQSIQTQGI